MCIRASRKAQLEQDIVDDHSWLAFAVLEEKSMLVDLSRGFTAGSNAAVVSTRCVEKTSWVWNGEC